MQVDFDATLNVVRNFIREKKGPMADQVQADTALLQDGYVDSFGLIALIAELEKQLQVTIPDGALIPEDFETPQVLFSRLQEV